MWSRVWTDALVEGLPRRPRQGLDVPPDGGPGRALMTMWLRRQIMRRQFATQTERVHTLALGYEPSLRNPDQGEEDENNDNMQAGGCLADLTTPVGFLMAAIAQPWEPAQGGLDCAASRRVGGCWPISQP
ncbi:uncharacterized protein SETTUDRAFT_36185 [Exserohilum turcica Et28A]|uniref:Uncharacterized protein n=1 Tax=Exserohilum turcicum (strain 28A) TaxID=671987 RepID=R0KNQ1_EXST2|nr:uncharacterized protein SETTUDRAFT_36185 [Exserohilum turcica Et28A]EOA90674.1 hypothetical protein SETTUDRAFT_36185 [Exserohilum turcica Et28A]